MRFEFASAARIIFGPGTVAQIGALARELGRRALVTTGLIPAQSERMLVVAYPQPVSIMSPYRCPVNRPPILPARAPGWHASRAAIS